MAAPLRHGTEAAFDYPVIRPHGGWSLLVDTRPLGLTPAAVARLLFDRAKIAAMRAIG